MGSNLFGKFENYALSKSELKKCQEQFLIHKNINNIIFQETEEGYCSPVEEKNRAAKGIWGNHWTFYFASLGVKMAFVEGDSAWHFLDKQYFSIFLTDFHLIITRGSKIKQLRDTQATIYEKPDDIMIVPLEKIKKLSLEHAGGRASSRRSYTEKKSPIKGAIVGGVVAGAPGAVVGAIANQGEKTKTIVTSGYDAYDLIINLENNKTVTLKGAIHDGNSTIANGGMTANYKLSEIKNKLEPKYLEPKCTEDFIKRMNEKLDFLVERAKKIENIDEKRNIVNETIQKGLDKKIKDENLEKYGCLIFFVVIFIILGIIL